MRDRGEAAEHHARPEILRRANSHASPHAGCSASRLYPTGVTLLARNSGKPELRCHRAIKSASGLLVNGAATILHGASPDLDRLCPIIYIPGLPTAWAHGRAGDKVPRIHRKTRPLDRRTATASRGRQAQGRAGQSAPRAPRLGRSARRVARQGGDGAGVPRRARDRLQHQRRDHDARFRQRPHLRFVHARRRHGPRRDDRLAQSHHRSRSFDLSRAAVGARRRLGAVRRIFQQRRAVPLLAAAAAARAARAAGGQGHGLASSAWRSSGICCASREDRLGDEQHRRSGRARASRSGPRRSSPAIPITPNPTWI